MFEGNPDQGRVRHDGALLYGGTTSTEARGGREFEASRSTLGLVRPSYSVIDLHVRSLHVRHTLSGLWSHIGTGEGLRTMATYAVEHEYSRPQS